MTARPRPRRALIRAVLGAVLAALASAGCAGLGKSAPAWVQAEFEVASDRILWEYALLALEKGGYPIGGGIDPANLEVLTGWQTHLSPFKGEGFRQRAELRMEAVEGGKYSVEVRVQRERNDSLSRPADPRYADWKSEPDDEMAARVLLQHVASYVSPPLELE